jgi:hypothetical protein
MSTLLALASLVALVWAFLSLVAAVLPSKRAARLRQSAIAGALFLVATIGAVLTAPSPEELAEQQAASAAKQLAAEVQKKEDERERAEQKVRDYESALAGQIEAVREFKAKEFTQDTASIYKAVSVLDGFAKFCHEGAALDLSEDAKKLRAELIKTLSKQQTIAFPILRDAYGPAMRRTLWESDGSAKTYSAGFRTVEFIAGEFAANRNIAKFQATVELSLKMLRFQQSRYRWFEKDSEYTYYSIVAPSDNEVVYWSDIGTPRPVD